MLDDILEKLKGQIGPELMEKFGLDENKKEKAFSTAKDSIKDAVKKETLSGSRLDGILNMFSKGDNNSEGNKMQDKVGDDMVTKLASSLGIDAEKATGIKDMILSNVTKMMGDKGGNFDVSSLLSMVTGADAKSGGGGILSKVFTMFGGKN